MQLLLEASSSPSLHLLGFVESGLPSLPRPKSLYICLLSWVHGKHEPVGTWDKKKPRHLYKEIQILTESAPKSEEIELKHDRQRT